MPSPRFAVRPWTLALAGVAVPGLLALAVSRSSPADGPRFRDVKELKAWAERHGLYCRSDRLDNKVVHGLAVSTEPLTWERVNTHACRAADADREGAWRGMIWAITRSACVDAMSTEPWYGECRVWGGVVVTGDSDLLDRVERGAR